MTKRLNICFFFWNLEENFIPKEINTFEDYNHIYMKQRKIITSPIYLICVIIFQLFHIYLKKKKKNVCFMFIFKKTIT